MTRTLDPWRFTRAARQANAQTISSTPETQKMPTVIDRAYAAHLNSDDTPIDRDQWEAENAALLTHKISLCLRNARDCARKSRNKENSHAHQREYKRMAQEALADAHYWRDGHYH